MIVIAVLSFFLIYPGIPLINSEVKSANFPDVTYIASLNLFGPSNITQIYTMNNSATMNVNGTLEVDAFTDKEVVGDIIVFSPGGQERADIKFQQENGITRIYGTISNILLGPGEILYQEILYRIKDAFEHEDGIYTVDLKYEEPRANEVTWIAKIPKTNSMIRHTDLRILTLHPHPQRIDDDGDYKVLVWTKPTQILESGIKQFQPIIRFKYEANWPLLFLVLAAAVIGGISSSIFYSMGKKLTNWFIPRRLEVMPEPLNEDEEPQIKNIENPKYEILVAEYQALNQAWSSRGHETVTYMSILISSSVLVAIAGLANLQLLRDAFLFPVRTGGFVPIIAIFPLLFALFLRQTAYRLDKLTFARIHDIESVLGIEGHKAIWGRIEKTNWYWFRRWGFPFLLALMILFYFGFALWIWFLWIP